MTEFPGPNYRNGVAPLTLGEAVGQRPAVVVKLLKAHRRGGLVGRRAGPGAGGGLEFRHDDALKVALAVPQQQMRSGRLQ